MKSTIRVEMCFDSGQPYLQLNVAESNPSNEGQSIDLADKTLKFFQEQANTHGLALIYIGINSMPQVRIRTSDIAYGMRPDFYYVNDLSEEFKTFLDSKGIKHMPADSAPSTMVYCTKFTPFELGMHFEKFRNNIPQKMAEKSE